MIYIRANDQTRLAVYDLNPGAQEAVVMVHGWPLSADMYEYQARVLAGLGYRVVTMDLRGFGRSDAPAGNYGYDRLSDDLLQVVRSLGLKNFTLVGFSMGGAIVLRYMRRHRGFGVKKLCLLAAAAPRFTTAPGFPYGQSPEAANGLVELAKTDRPQLCENFSRQLLASPHSEAIKDWFRSTALSASGIGTVETAVSLRDEDGRGDLAAVRVPTGIFHGVKDEVVPFSLGQLQNRSIQGSRLFAFPESGHAVFYDELERFNRAFLLFLKR